VAIANTGGSALSVAGNITGGNLVSAVLTSAGNLTLTSTAANAWVFLTPTGTGTIQINKDITNGQANGVGNIGNATGYFNTIFAKATSAQYADLAETYAGDRSYAPGTVLSFGGANEVTLSHSPGDVRVAGVVSTNPSYVMNAGLTAAYPVVIALTGRVPTSVTGNVRKGDMMVSNGDGTACASARPEMGSVLGKALEDFTGDTGVIEVVIGRL
jgi:hypothetical protein